MDNYMKALMLEYPDWFFAGFGNPHVREALRTNYAPAEIPPRQLGTPTSYPTNVSIASKRATQTALIPNKNRIVF